jgi:hypothetical protein
MQAGKYDIQLLLQIVINIQLTLEIDNIGLNSTQDADSLHYPGYYPHIFKEPKMRSPWHGRTMIGYSDEFDAPGGRGLNIFGKRAVGMATGDGMGMTVYFNVHEIN